MIKMQVAQGSYVDNEVLKGVWGKRRFRKEEMQGEARRPSLELSPLLSPLSFQLSSILPSHSVHFLYLSKSWEEQISSLQARQCSVEGSPSLPALRHPLDIGACRKGMLCAPAPLYLFTM